MFIFIRHIFLCREERMKVFSISEDVLSRGRWRERFIFLSFLFSCATCAWRRDGWKVRKGCDGDVCIRAPLLCVFFWFSVFLAQVCVRREEERSLSYFFSFFSCVSFWFGNNREKEACVCVETEFVALRVFLCVFCGSFFLSFQVCIFSEKHMCCCSSLIYWFGVLLDFWKKD